MLTNETLLQSVALLLVLLCLFETQQQQQLE